MSVQRGGLEGEESHQDLLAISPSSPLAVPAGTRRAWTLLVSWYTHLNFKNPETEKRFREQYQPLPGPSQLARMFTGVPLSAGHLPLCP